MEEAKTGRPLPIARVVAPRSVAVVGASDDVGKFGGRVIHYLQKHGFPGQILPINPEPGDDPRLPAFPRVSAAPVAADVAILAVPATSLEAQVADCAVAGVGACIIITGKLAEAGPEGAALQDRVLAIARAAGMRLVGPNCPSASSTPSIAPCCRRRWRWRRRTMPPAASAWSASPAR